MNVSLKQPTVTLSMTCPVEIDIRSNCGWLGNISGLNAEKLLRGLKTPYLYVLREGEHQGDYYVTFVRPDHTIAHVPFHIKLTDLGWHYENSGLGILSIDTRLDDVLYLIMHCEKDQCRPLIQ